MSLAASGATTSIAPVRRSVAWVGWLVLWLALAATWAASLRWTLGAWAFGAGGRWQSVAMHDGRTYVTFSTLPLGSYRAWTVLPYADDQAEPDAAFPWGERARTFGWLAPPASDWTAVWPSRDNTLLDFAPADFVYRDLRIFGFLVTRLSDGSRAVAVASPGWVVLLVAAVPVVLRVRRSRRTIRWAAEGRCRSCGYDLRASPDRCPECGTEPVASPLKTVG